jgi:RIO-like serine/threonine protein kinase
MQPLDTILELVRDSNWHSLDEIGSRVPLSEDTFEKVIAFLEENEFISLDDDTRSARIKTLGLRFLELPTGY